MDSSYGLFAKQFILLIIRGNKLLRMQIFGHISQRSGISRNERGFTLIELVMVIVILGVLAAVALPKFVDLSSDAQAAATNGVAGAISSASTINFGARSVNSSHGRAILECSDAGNLLEGGLSSDYVLGGSSPPTPVPAGTTVNCTLTGPKSTSATVAVTGIL